MKICCCSVLAVDPFLFLFLSKKFANRIFDHQVPPASVPLAKPSKADDPHLLGLDPGLPGHSGALLRYRQSGGQEVDGDEAGEY